jgi:hypothetical protein
LGFDDTPPSDDERRIARYMAIPGKCEFDNDPLYRFRQWLANLRVLEVVT